MWKVWEERGRMWACPVPEVQKDETQSGVFQCFNADQLGVTGRTQWGNSLQMSQLIHVQYCCQDKDGPGDNKLTANFLTQSLPLLYGRCLKIWQWRTNTPEIWWNRRPFLFYCNLGLHQQAKYSFTASKTAKATILNLFRMTKCYRLWKSDGHSCEKRVAGKMLWTCVLNS